MPHTYMYCSHTTPSRAHAHTHPDTLSCAHSMRSLHLRRTRAPPVFTAPRVGHCASWNRACGDDLSFYNVCAVRVSLPLPPPAHFPHRVHRLLHTPKLYNSIHHIHHRCSLVTDGGGGGNGHRPLGCPMVPMCPPPPFTHASVHPCMPPLGCAFSPTQPCPSDRCVCGGCVRGECLSWVSVVGRYDPPFALAGELQHPVEFLFNILVPLMAGPVITALTTGVHGSCTMA
jgi:hypothetical protein